MIFAILPLVALFTLAAIENSVAQDSTSRERERMVKDIAALAAMAAADTGRPVFSERVMAAMAKVPRHRFVPADLSPHAYEDRPLPIGEDQTISQPYIVALMTELADPRPDHRVLEVGTGSGYQAAVLAELTHAVYTIEIVEPLARRAQESLRALGYANVYCRVGDGYNGWPEQAPFHSIIVTAATPVVPQPLIDQLAPGGRLVIPLGGQFEVQQLTVIEKTADGRTTHTRALPVRFVPLTRTKPAR